MDMFKMQEMVKNNANDMHKAIADLVDWSSSANDKEKKGTTKQ